MTDTISNKNDVIGISENTENKTEMVQESIVATAGSEVTIADNTSKEQEPDRKEEIDICLKYILECNVSDEQKKLILQIYDSVKIAVKDTISEQAINETIKITKTIGYIIKQLENIKVDNKSPSGTDKKVVAINLGRIIIKELLSNETKILELYDVIAEPTLEAMIDVSKVVNTVIMEASRKCCPGLLELFKTTLRSRK
jgi:hypothetical protein